MAIPPPIASFELDSCLCRRKDDGQLVFGKLRSLPSQEQIHDHNYERLPMTPFVIQWEDCNNTANINVAFTSGQNHQDQCGAAKLPSEDEQANTVVYDKLFQEGQIVQRISDGLIGQIVSIKPLATAAFSFEGSRFVISNIPLDRIVPITTLFPGIKVAYKGWIGEIEYIKEELHCQLHDAENHSFRTKAELRKIPELFTETEVPLRLSYLEPAASGTEELTTNNNSAVVYPYYKAPGCRIPLVGQTMRFRFMELRYADWNGFTSWKRRPYILGWHFRRKESTFLDVKEPETKIDWKYAYVKSPAAGSKPKTYLYTDEIKTFQPQFIFPYEFIAKEKSLGMLQIEENDYQNISIEKNWILNFVGNVKNLDVQEKVSTKDDDEHEHGPSPCKKSRNDEDAGFPLEKTQLPVELYILRHELTVQWDNGNSAAAAAKELSKIMASEVQALRVPLPFKPIPTEKKYLKYKPYLYYPNQLQQDEQEQFETDLEFGVNLGQSSEGIIDVMWVYLEQEEVDAGEAAETRKFRLKSEERQKVPIFDIEFLTEFGNFKTGQIVTRNELCTDPNFNVGTIQKLQFNGKILIRDGNRNPPIHLWPLEIQHASPQEKSKLVNGYIRPSFSVKSFNEITQNLSRNFAARLESLEKSSFNDNAPVTHYFISEPKRTSSSIIKTLKIDIIREYVDIPKVLPDRVWIRSFVDRYDLHSLLIIGPDNTPFEKILFTFDIFLPSNYPNVLPIVHFNQLSGISISPYIHRTNGIVNLEALSPPLIKAKFPRGNDNESQDVYSLGTIVSKIHEAIFQPSPFITSEVVLDKKDLNQEAMIAKQNQAVAIASLDICLQQLSNPPEPWSTHITRYYKENLHRIADKYQNWATTGDNHHGTAAVPFPFRPTTDGFNRAFNRRIQILNQISNNLR